MENSMYNNKSTHNILLMEKDLLSISYIEDIHMQPKISTQFLVDIDWSYRFIPFARFNARKLRSWICFVMQLILDRFGKLDQVWVKGDFKSLQRNALGNVTIQFSHKVEDKV